MGANLLAARAELLGCHGKIRHCLEQLTTEQIWWRPTPEMNAIGNLVLHLAGNIRQWIIAGVGGAGDIRDRPAEFSERTQIPRETLLPLLAATVESAAAVLESADEADLPRVRTVQNRDVTGAYAVMHSTAHFAGHTQEIIHMTRVQLGSSYVTLWSPPVGAATGAATGKSTGEATPSPSNLANDHDAMLISESYFLSPQYFPSDAEALIEFLDNRTIYDRTLRIPHPYTRAHAEHWLRIVPTLIDLQGRPLRWGIRRRENGLLIGGIAFEYPVHSPHRAELGYWLAEPFWGQGIMTAAVERICDEAFRVRGIQKLTAVIFANNIGSCRVVEKCGFTLEGSLRHHYCKDGKLFDARYYGRTAQQ